MSRRLLAVLIACCLVALSASAVAFAHGTGARKHHHHAKVHRTGKPAAFLGAGLFGASVNSLAQRLSVDPAALRTAIRQTIAQEQAKQLTAAGLTPDEIAALKACRTRMHPLHAATRKARRADTTTPACDTAALKSAQAKLKTARAHKPDLDARLTQAVTAGWLTQKGHDLALACFDDPNSCDLKALKAEIRFPGHKPQPSTSTPTGTTPPGTMTPGSRPTSTPLRG